MGQTQQQQTVPWVSHHVVQTDVFLMTTMGSALIRGTVDPADEERAVNALMEKRAWATPIVVYGDNWSDAAPARRCRQLASLGFGNARVYGGGAFEWLLLRELYGADAFPLASGSAGSAGSAGSEVDPLDHQPRSSFPASTSASQPLLLT